MRSSDVSDQVVSQVGKAVLQIVKLREVEAASIGVIGEQGLTIAEYNEVIARAQGDPDLEERILVACRAG